LWGNNYLKFGQMIKLKLVGNIGVQINQIWLEKNGQNQLNKSDRVFNVQVWMYRNKNV